MTELVARGISVSLSSVEVLKEVSITLGAGSIVGLIGPNGAGKTTLLNVLSGRMRPTKGEVLLNGKSVSRQRRSRLAGMGMFRSYQEARLFESLTAEENIDAAVQPPPDERLLTALLTRARLESRGVVGEALLAVDMETNRKVVGRQMSYGMRKRTIMGQAIAANASVILLDEPLSGLDPGTREKVLSVIRALRDPGRIVLVIEHDLEAIGAFTDRVLLMDRGQIVADGQPREVLSSAAVLDVYLRADGQ